MSLFRKEVKLYNKLEGDIVFSLPLSHKLIFRSIVFLVVMLITFLLNVEFTRSVKVTGYTSLNKGEVIISAPNDGYISKSYIKVGDNVKEGQVLFEVRTNDFSYRYKKPIDNINKQIESLIEKREASVQLLASNIASIKLKIKKLNEEIANDHELIEVRNERISMQKTKKEIYESLKMKGSIGVDKVISEGLDYFELVEESKLYKSALIRKEATIEELNQKIKELDIANTISLSDLDSKILLLKNELFEINSKSIFIVKSPISGTITSEQISFASYVKSSSPLIIIAPENSKVEAVLLVPSESIGNIEINNIAFIKYDAYSYQYYGKYRGVIYQINDNAIFESKILNIESSGSRRVYLVKVKLDSEFVTSGSGKYKIKPGIKVSANILIEKQTLIKWLFAPIYIHSGTLFKGFE
ncbi:HlyD family efflux transporter periplasmic adaptor subunit [Vibrio aestuarianus subsp. cardii]|uniref:HlyD family secretion protein n=1 Tax=Vibrio aestuarianus TaxID=28171 RepID=UPI00159339F4|nr:HlyD family efflux transporter periplasmic adaptor subunit [Vibrio aestuarianus]MDE1310370.1 HlyD family secretion protein [Vibrio aestuarianus]NGZ94353.1 HlyD family efflux transporter periplasmic adaptor subunit [Vibrio aestuarianus subsp. cardii]